MIVENRSRQGQQLQIQTCRSSLWRPAAYSIVGAWARIMPLFWAGLCHHPGMRRIMGLSRTGLFHYRPPYCVWHLSWLRASKCRSLAKNTRQHFNFKALSRATDILIFFLNIQTFKGFLCTEKAILQIC